MSRKNWNGPWSDSPKLSGGRLMVEITGPGKERFFNIAARRGLLLSDIREVPGEKRVYFTTTPECFFEMKPAAKKAGVRLRIKRKSGLPFFLYRNRKRKLYAGGFLLFFLILYQFSFFIWDISFEGNRRFTDEMLMHYMETIPVVCGMRKSGISCEKLEEDIRNQFTEITWVSAEIKGTRLILRIKENEALLSAEKRDESPCDLTAAKDGVIVRTIVRSGFSDVKAGDEVKKGDRLVSGTIPITDDSEAIVNSHLVHADGEIYARTTEEFVKHLSAVKKKNALTGRARYGIYIECFGHSFYGLLPDFKKENNWEFLMEQRQLRLFQNFYLPVYGARITAREYVSYEEAVGREEAEKAGNRYLKEYMEKLDEKGVQIIGNNVKIERNESGWQIRGILTVVEDIAKEAPIPENQEEIQTENEHH